ncbi:MAG TPA: hypothetical protein VNG51_02755, partial [Ktedonobacteraceae bacterium]|nr:hypothetical protein [Ktedonobacteraceae bacterium]
THFQAPLIAASARTPLPDDLILHRTAAYPVSPGQPGRHSHKKKAGRVPIRLTADLYAFLQQ